MDNLDYIDNYFSNIQTAGVKEEFEKKIHSDSHFAEEVAFYLSTMQAANEQAKQITKERFREIYSQYKQTTPVPATEKPPSLVRKLWPYIAAAAVITGIVFGLNIWWKSASPQQLADKYVQEHFQKLSITMNSKEDSLQTGLRLYNENKHEQSLAQFESIVQHDPSSFQAKRYAGIVSLRLGEYDKALKYFEELENYPGLQVNPGKIYHAITLMKRGQQGDKEKAKQLLNEVDQYNLEGKNQAREWLRKL
ncbi:MAG: hypothetical protein WDO19_16420 [Bacteroidota bacterium]